MLGVVVGELERWVENGGMEGEVEELERNLVGVGEDYDDEGEQGIWKRKIEVLGTGLGLVCMVEGAERWGWSEQRKERLGDQGAWRGG